ncbi:leucine-rich repeat flightless-interacting protein 2 isoform X3 [Folsomia candida]|uniref:leucine-rich repeat flightless-interacting protein 2 isoform X3 n=1 Tax=Folsomia candida TaxID=158441 RepID=UPI000B907FF7|nr:leucine-rich repeat flightless-interacting protein 2 isoform X3 [Folsomia candida]
MDTTEQNTTTNHVGHIGSRRRSQNKSQYSVEEQALDQIAKEAEARLAARRQARAEAREIRMKELEKQQKESDDSADRHYDMYAPGNGVAVPNSGVGDVVNRAAFRVALGHQRSSTHSVGSASYHSSRRSSEDSSEDGVINMRELRHDLKELEEKFRKSMVQNAQLDNSKSSLTYEVELLKDKIEDLEESLTLLQREHKDKCRDFENLKRLSTQIKEELEYYKSLLHERDELIKEYGLVLVENEVEVDVGNGGKEIRIKRTLVSHATADVLSKLGQGSLDVRLNKVIEEKNELQDEITRLKLELEEERSSKTMRGGGGTGLNNNLSNHFDDGENETEISKQIAEYRFKTQKYEQEIAALLANVGRLDTQVQRYKTSSEEAELREDDLKVERRKLQRELREAQSKLDELETTNSHLQKRLDKLKTAKSTLLKEL